MINPIKWIRQVITKLIHKKSIKQKLGVDIAISGDMENAITLWSDIYANKAPWLSNAVKSLNLGAIIASEIARMVTIEFSSKIAGSARADYLDTQYQPFLKHARDYVEYCAAKGGIAFKPYISGDKILVDAVQADRFFPTAYDGSGNITGAIFVEQIKSKRCYTRLEHHNFEGGKYEIVNKAYVSDDESTLGMEITLDNVDKWSDIAPMASIMNIEKPLFSYFKTAAANTIDTSSPLGVSVYARGAELIEEADKQYGRFVWEYEGSELAIDVDVTLFDRDKNGKPMMPKGKERLYRSYQGLGGDDKEAIKTFSPTIRDQSLINGLNKILTRIEDACGLARGTISDVQETAKTATEITMMRQRTYATVVDNQKSFQDALEQLVYAMDVWATLGKLAPKGDFEIAFDWDDSVIVDSVSEQAIRLSEVQAGIISKLEYIKWRYGIKDDAEAKKLMPNMEELMDDGDAMSDGRQTGSAVDDVVDTAESIAGSSLNGAQTQSLISVLAQYQAGSLTFGQAVNIISIAIGISKEEAKKVLEGAE